MTTYQVGDRVLVPLGARKVKGFITEDRGAIGVQGRRLYRVAIPVEPDEPISFELPESEIQSIPESESADRELDPVEVDDYLMHGGLALILQAESSGGKGQPRIWLCRDTRGNLTHTFVEERGLLGGSAVPGMASQWGRVFAPKRDEVLTYLESFGLDRGRAEKVVAAVGTYPRPKRKRSEAFDSEGDPK